MTRTNCKHRPPSPTSSSSILLVYFEWGRTLLGLSVFLDFFAFFFFILSKICLEHAVVVNYTGAILTRDMPSCTLDTWVTDFLCGLNRKVCLNATILIQWKTTGYRNCSGISVKFFVKLIQADGNSILRSKLYLSHKLFV